MDVHGTARFRLLGKLGEGSMGVVYEAFDRVLGMRVALKALRSLDATYLYRLKREFRAVSDLCHPNIVAFYELVAEDDDYLLVMEPVDGPDLIGYVRAGRTPPGIRSHRPVMATGSQSEETTVTVVMRPAPRPAGAHSADPDAPERDRDPEVADTIALDQVVEFSRLRGAFAQLADAIDALHRAHMIHRDLKPSNVRVTPDDRVVLMDFGVVAELGRPPDPALQDHVVGTPAYMAPEQMRGAAPGPAADWYAFGAMLYLALTGRRPHEGSFAHLQVIKASRDPLPPGLLVGDLPPALDRLCMQLLRRDPADRPRGPEVLAALEALSADPIRRPRATAQLPPEGEAPVFVGRAPERAALRAAYDAVVAGQSRCVVVEGPSGMGKSCLVERAVADLLAEHDDSPPLLLSGRCHERESLTYKAFDGVIDDLARGLLAMPEPRRVALLDQVDGDITRLFPVLSRVPELAGVAPRERGVSPVTLRTHAIAALRRLLAAITASRPVIIAIEDVQWAEHDCLVLLRGLLDPPAPPRLLVVATRRDDSDDANDDDAADADAADDAATATDDTADDHGSAGELDRLIRALEARGLAERLVLGPMSENEQALLVRHVAAAHGAAVSVDERLLREAGGHPMLLIELARAAGEGTGAVDATPALETLLWRRVSRLPEPARALMELVAVAGEATPLWVLAHAARLRNADRERAETICRVSRLVRVSGARERTQLTAYHDKVRQAVLDRLSEDRRREHHGRLAQILDSWGEAPAARLARHWEHAGDRGRAATLLLDAAEHAAHQLATARAAELYRKALALLDELDELRELAGPDEAGKRAERDRLRCRAWLGLVDGMRVTDDSDGALAVLDRAQVVAEAHDFAAERAVVHYLRGSLRFPRGDLDGCLSEHQQAREHARRAGSTECEARALGGLGDAHYMGGRMLTAYRYLSDCIELCRRHGFVDIEVAHLTMRGVTHYYQNQLAVALRDGDDAATAAARGGYTRAEVVARCGLTGWILIEMGHLDRARREFEAALGKAKRLGARRFEAVSHTFLARIAALEGDHDQAEALAHQAIAGCRDTGEAFFGPMALAVLGLATRDPGERARAFEQAQAVLAAGAPAHNHLYVYRDGMDAALAAGELDRVDDFAAALEAYTRPEPLPWSRLFIARGRALAAWERHARGAPGPGDPAPERLRETMQTLADEARAVGLTLAAGALEQRLGADEQRLGPA
ncbi:serine/threonine-protein kinase PknK [Haliangium sp.]|uniref:serine/threonine-protein kinase n=1 Tax=Haliangium sp. TaxID=2663208 RepID=UPI003D10CE21